MPGRSGGPGTAAIVTVCRLPERGGRGARGRLAGAGRGLDRFAAKDPVKAELVKLRYFAGLSEAEAAAALGISRATASRYWTYARAWLINALDEKPE